LELSDRELFERYKHDVYALCRYMVRDASDAEDLCQETFIQALSVDRSSVEQLKPWLIRIAINRCNNHLGRSRRRRVKETLAFMLRGRERGNPVEERMERMEASTEMNRLYSRLPAKIRMTLTLRYVNDLSLQEIADVLSVPLGTVKSRMHKGHGMLRKWIGPSLKEEKEGFTDGKRRDANEAVY